MYVIHGVHYLAHRGKVSESHETVLLDGTTCEACSRPAVCNIGPVINNIISIWKRERLLSS